jgi:hypothetical protein
MEETQLNVKWPSRQQLRANERATLKELARKNRKTALIERLKTFEIMVYERNQKRQKVARDRKIAQEARLAAKSSTKTNDYK